MSFLFDGLNDHLEGTLTTAVAKPRTIACFIKIAAHPIAADTLIQLGLSASNNDSIRIKTTTTDNQWQVSCVNSAGSVETSTLSSINLDGVWAGIVAIETSATSREIYIQTITNHDINVASGTVSDLLKIVRIGENLYNGDDFTGRLAECAVWSSALSVADVTSYLAGVAASTISPTTLRGYWPLNSADLTNQGLDTAGDLTASGAAAFDADHPTISGGGGSFTLAVTAANFSIAGSAITNDKGMPVTKASFSIAASAIIGAIGLTVASAAIQPVGQNISLAWTGQPTLTVNVDAATFSVLGSQVDGRRAVPVTAASFQIDGSDVGFRWKGLTVEGAQPSVAGQDVILELGKDFDRAFFSVVGQSIALHKGTPVIAATPSIAGQSITLTLGNSPVGEVTSANFSVLGQDIAFQQTWSILVDSAAFSILGKDVALQFQIDSGVTVSEAHLQVDGQSVNLDRGIVVSSTAFSVQPQAIPLNVGISVQPALFQIVGSDVSFENTFTLGVTVIPAEFSVVGGEQFLFLGDATPTKIVANFSSWTAYGSFSAPIAQGSITTQQVQSG